MPVDMNLHFHLFDNKTMDRVIPSGLDLGMFSMVKGEHLPSSEKPCYHRTMLRNLQSPTQPIRDLTILVRSKRTPTVGGSEMTVIGYCSMRNPFSITDPI